MKHDPKTFSQFSERLVDLNLTAKTTRNKRSEESGNQGQSSVLENLLVQLKIQNEAVKNTISHRVSTIADVPQSNNKTYINTPTGRSLSNIQGNRNGGEGSIIKSSLNDIDHQTRSKSRVPIVNSITIVDDLQNDSIEGKNQPQNHNYLDNLDLPISSSILGNNSQLNQKIVTDQKESPKFNNSFKSNLVDSRSNELNDKKNIIKDLKLPNNSGLEEIDIGEPYDQGNRENNINDDQKNQNKSLTPLMSKIKDSYKGPKENLKNKNAGPLAKALKKKDQSDEQELIVEGKSEGSDDGEGNKNKQLDYYSKNLKSKSGKARTEQIDEIREEKGESEDEEEKERRREEEEQRERERVKEEEEQRERERVKEEEEQREREKEKEEEEQREREREEEEQREREKEEEEQREREREEERQRQKQKEEKQRKKEEQERLKKQKEKEQKEEQERQKQKKKEEQERQRQKEKEELERQKRKEAEQIKKNAQKNRKQSNEWEEEELEDESEENNVQLNAFVGGNAASTSKNKNKRPEPKKEYFEPEVQDIDDIPELNIEDTVNTKNSRKRNDSRIKTEAKSNTREDTKTKKNQPDDSQRSGKQKKKNLDNSVKMDSEQDDQPQAVNPSQNNNKLKARKKGSGMDEGGEIIPSRIRERIVREMNEFDTEHPDLTNEFILLRSFKGKEKHLPQTIPNYQKTVMESEGNKIFLQRRDGFLDNAYFKSRLEVDDTKNDFSNFLQKSRSPYPKVMAENYANLTNKKQLFSKINNPITDSFLENAPKGANADSVIIGDIENICTFIYKYSLNLLNNLMESAINAFSYWRQVKSDGNSFYRVVMFSIFEQLILKKDIESIQMICNEIKNMEDFFKDKKIEHEVALAIFKMITEEISNDNVEDAYNIFNKAYNNMKNDMFDKTLIFYLRNIASKYIKETYDSIEREVKKSGAKLDKSYFLNYLSVVEDNIEPEFEIITMIKYLFNTDIELFWLDGSFDKPLFGHSKLLNKNNHPQKGEITISTIYIGYFFSSYYIIYPQKSKIKSEVLKEGMNEALASFTQLVYIQKHEKSKCGLCGRNSSKIYFLEKLFYSCFECLREYINEVLTDRAKAYALANFVSLECKYIYLLY